MMATVVLFARHAPTSRHRDGGGGSDLYRVRAPQRAGPTAHKTAESNRVLTVKRFGVVIR